MARANIVPIFVPHLGCPKQCVFCDQRRISGSAMPAGGEDVTRALERARALGIFGAELAFYGGSFTAVPAALQEELLAAAQPYRREGLIQSLRVSTRPDAVDTSTLRRLKVQGVATVELGAQSMDETVLAASGRGHTAADTARAAALVKAEGLQLVLQMMTGLPKATAHSDLATARALMELSPDAVRIYPTVILRGTELERLWRAGVYNEHTVSDAVSLCAELLPLFEAAHIPVIRLGLNPSEELSGGEAVGGAYHPALGELVRSEIWRRRATALIERLPAGSSPRLGVHKSRVSVMIGQKRENIRRLCADLGFRSLSVEACACGAEEILLLDGGRQ